MHFTWNTPTRRGIFHFLFKNTVDSHQSCETACGKKLSAGRFVRQHFSWRPYKMGSNKGKRGSEDERIIRLSRGKAHDLSAR
jgi:hypothetical protein